MIPNDNSIKSDKTSMDAMNVWCPYKPWSQTQGMAPTSYHSSTERQVPRKGLFLQSKHKLTNQHDQHCMLKIVEVFACICLVFSSMMCVSVVSLGEEQKESKKRRK